VYPGVGVVYLGADRGHRVDGAAGRLADLGAHDRRGMQWRDQGRAHPALPVGPDADHPVLPETQQPQGGAQLRVRVVADDHGHRGRRGQALPLDVPADLGKYPVPGGGECGERGRAGVADHRAGGTGREGEQVDQPAQRGPGDRVGYGGAGPGHEVQGVPVQQRLVGQLRDFRCLP